MVDETTKPTFELLEVLNELKSHLETLNTDKNERDKVLETYRTKILPNLLRIRQLNRISKDKLEERYALIRQVNQKLLVLSDSWQNLTFEASCLRYDVSSAKQRLSPRKQAQVEMHGDVQMESKTMQKEDVFDIDQVSLLDHNERTKVLEVEETKRKQLCDKLNDLTSETDHIADLCQASEQEINRVKPYIKTLIDKVDTGDPNCT